VATGKEQIRVPLRTIATEWTRIGCIGFGGPPAHISLFRQLCVSERGWIPTAEFEDAIAATNLLPGPASTQLAIFAGWRLGGPLGAIVGGTCFILPGLILILALSAVFLASSLPLPLAGAAAGAGAAVAAVAIHAATGLLPASWTRARSQASPVRWSCYVAVGVLSGALFGVWLVLLLLACGAAEALIGRPRGHLGESASRPTTGLSPVTLLAVKATPVAGLAALCWTALKVGALSFGGGFVIIPLMQADAVHRYHWMTAGQFLNAVALGQLTPGPVVHTVAAVGYAAGGIAGGLLAAAVAFGPSFVFILVGAARFDRLRGNATVQRFFTGAGPAAIGGIAGSAVPLARALAEPWQFAVLGLAIGWLLLLRRGVVSALLLAALLGVAAALAGLQVPV
jgi:chromate transporter